MRNFALLIFCFVAFYITTGAEEPTDSAQAKELREVVVSARLQRTTATVSTYIPTRRQKNSAQTGTELLGHMAIPQLGLVSGNTVSTSSGQTVDMFIDYVPATEQDLSGMRMADVKTVEYYDYPQDPRFLGKAHVINFVMQKYEYGGYVKAYANEFLISNSGQLNLFTKFQYRKMTYDLAVGGWYSDNDHLSSATVETYRLPQTDGSVKTLERVSEPDEACVRNRSLWPTFKASFNSSNVTMVNTLGANFYFAPKENTAGRVGFLPAEFPATEYESLNRSHTTSITYSGYWNFILPHGNSINVNPYYSYSHTNQRSLYTEAAGTALPNGAIDDSHRATTSVRYVHNFGRPGNITALCNVFYGANRTRYSGTSDASDRLITFRAGPGLLYNYNNAHFDGLIGAGVNYDRSRFGGKTEHSTQPWVDLSLQYSINDKNSAGLEFHHSSWTAASSFRSTAVIQSNPLLRYTGNPDLKSYGSYDIGLRYVWMPSNRWNISAFCYGWFTANRYAYFYEASPEGILRTIRQPAGGFSQWRYGVTATLRLLDNKLSLNGQLACRVAHDGEPFGWTKGGLHGYIHALYYAEGWNFGVQYQSPQEYSDGNVSGTWVTEKSACAGIVGWGNSAWSLQARLTNPFRWSWVAGHAEMTSTHYDVHKTLYNTSYHCYVLVSATYTIGFGKKIQRGNEASQQMGTASSILK